MIEIVKEEKEESEKYERLRDWLGKSYKIGVIEGEVMDLVYF